MSGVPSHTKDSPSSQRYAPVSWNCYFDEKRTINLPEDNRFNVYTKGSDGVLLLLLHGGGYSGLSWACFTYITSAVTCYVVAVDLRNHGMNRLSLKRLHAVAPINFVSSKAIRSIVLVGHSMGGAVAIEVARSKKLESLAGLVVIDVVEGSAIRSLGAMKGVLRSRPSSFASMEKAIEWSVRSEQVRNVESARVSMPGQFIARESSEPTCDKRYIWRTNLFKTEQFWEGWFKGMSEKFLSSPVPKLLILADVDRLDVTLTRAQMQGKFQVTLMQHTGHCVHEDSPDKVGETIAQFLVRFRLATAVAPLEGKMPC
ncbi:protein phosphatase methylesterase 1 [Trichuris trichiura]|uniref:Protein phosphatase methylesterase 1 n=1 Tax=Trichuris trichiura TaxID=36087 RepID=A0A077Z170_TRITR|nr:protein phosphatase methylesterase 1 [Trichuris trichiura]